jgi:hypothetical protein
MWVEESNTTSLFDLLGENNVIVATCHQFVCARACVLALLSEMKIVIDAIQK